MSIMAVDIDALYKLILISFINGVLQLEYQKNYVKEAYAIFSEIILQFLDKNEFSALLYFHF